MSLPRRLSKRLTSCYISTFRLGVHELQSLVSIRGLGWFIFLNTQVLLWDVAQVRKKAMKNGNFCIGIESTTALPWIPKLVSFIISIPALFHMGESMYAMVVSSPSTLPFFCWLKGYCTTIQYITLLTRNTLFTADKTMGTLFLSCSQVV